MIINSRPYADAADLQAMLNLLIAARPASQITDYPSIVDLQEMVGTAEVQAHTQLWEDNNHQLLAFAIIRNPYNQLIFEIAPQAVSDDALEEEIIAWGMKQVRSAARRHKGSIKLKTSCRDYNTERITLLKRHGFIPLPVPTLHLRRPLDAPIPLPQLPDGFNVRHVAGEEEVEAYVALHRAAFGTQYMTVEYRLSMMHTPDYDPELDLIAVAPDGRLAAFCVCHISQEENARTGRNEGYTDPVGTHPDFQRQGLARALLLTGLHLLKQRGMGHALLSTLRENIPMQRAAASVGFQIQSTTIFFEKGPW
jgi:ribosomal protein S18 acetylase RimI-like enzyme